MVYCADLAIAWNWEYDAGFLNMLEEAAERSAVSLYQITTLNLDEVLKEAEGGRFAFRALLDRAGDVDERFHPLSALAAGRGLPLFNRRLLACRAWDKSTMHLEFITAGLHTPYTLVLPPFLDVPDCPHPDLAPLGDTFLVKPAHGGGGAGVCENPDDWNHIQEIRRQSPGDKYLIQSMVKPMDTPYGPAWFRVIFSAGIVLPFWWDVQTHVYRRVVAPEIDECNLGELYSLMRRIQAVTRLDLFSTEIVRAAPAEPFVCVDYVNDPIDLRLQSGTPDGVPDEAVACIAGSLIRAVLQDRCERPPVAGLRR